MMRLVPFSVAAATICFFGISAQAVVISKEVNFTATLNTGDPTYSAVDYGPVYGTFDITFDNGADALNQTTGISLVSNTGFYLDSAISYSYSAGSDTLNVGGLQANDTTTTDPNATQVLSTVPESNDFSLRIGNFSTSPIFLNMAMTLRTASYGGIVWTTTDPSRGSVTVKDIAPVPLPAGLPLLAGALCVLFPVVRRRRKRIA